MGGQRLARAALPRERPDIHSTMGAFVRAGRISRSPGTEPRTSTPVASRYTDYARANGDNIKMDLKEIVCNDVDLIQWAKGNVTVRQVPIKADYFHKTESNYSSDLRTIPTD